MCTACAAVWNYVQACMTVVNGPLFNLSTTEQAEMTRRCLRGRFLAHRRIDPPPGATARARREKQTCHGTVWHAAWPAVMTPTQPKVPEAKARGPQEGFQCVLVSPERVLGVQNGVPRGPVGPLGSLELAALSVASIILSSSSYSRSCSAMMSWRKCPGGSTLWSRLYD